MAISPLYLQVTPSHPPMVGRRLDVNATEWPVVGQVRVRVRVRFRVRVRVRSARSDLSTPTPIP